VPRKKRVVEETTPPPGVPALASGAFSSPLAGYFSSSPGKTMSIMPNQPLEGWITLSFTEPGDEFHLNDQMMMVPQPHFDAAIKQYLGAKAEV
jgi:hypothetical protein